MKGKGKSDINFVFVCSNKYHCFLKKKTNKKNKTKLNRINSK